MIAYAYSGDIDISFQHTVCNMKS